MLAGLPLYTFIAWCLDTAVFILYIVAYSFFFIAYEQCLGTHLQLECMAGSQDIVLQA